MSFMVKGGNKMKIKRISILLLIIMFAILLVGCNNSDTASKSDEDQVPEDDSQSTTDEDSTSSGGVLNLAVAAQPPVMDPMMTTATGAIEIARNIFETLVTVDEDYQPTLMLAESLDISEDGLTYTFKLREGITFHNGQEMTSEDVVASMDRWKEISSGAVTYLEGITFEAEDTYTVVLTVPKATTDVLNILASSGQFAAVMPKEVIESAEVEGVTELIGTGPFKFEEWIQDQYIHLSKFEEYQLLDEEPSGTAGKKEPLVDDVYFHFISDTSTRLAGIQTGEYDISDTMPYDNYEYLLEMDGVETFVSFESGLHSLFFNKKAGLMANEKMRQAVNAALDNDAVMRASYASEELYFLDANYMNPAQIEWATDAGKEFYNQNDPKKAKQLLEEAGYNGEELVLITSRDYDYHYNAGVVVKEQLEQIGMNVALEVYDWPTYQERREDPENWDMITIGTSYSSTPAQQVALDPNWIGWTDHPKITELIELTRTADSQEEAQAAWAELQEFLWAEYVPVIGFGHKSRIIATTDKVDGFEIFNGPIIWNVTVSE